jgi:ribosome-interacting GTPase 1
MATTLAKIADIEYEMSRT